MTSKHLLRIICLSVGWWFNFYDSNCVWKSSSHNNKIKVPGVAWGLGGAVGLFLTRSRHWCCIKSCPTSQLFKRLAPCVKLQFSTLLEIKLDTHTHFLSYVSMMKYTIPLILKSIVFQPIKKKKLKKKSKRETEDVSTEGKGGVYQAKNAQSQSYHVMKTTTKLTLGVSSLRILWCLVWLLCRHWGGFQL